MTPDLIWKDFSTAMADIVLSQRATKNFSDAQLQRINEQKELIKEHGWGEEAGHSAHNMSFIDPRTGGRIFYGFRKLDADERMTQVILKKNREYQCLIMEAYEKFEDAIESIYALLGKSDINFWPLAEYGNKKYNDISGLSFEFYADKAEKRKGGAISIVKTLFDFFKCDCDLNRITLRQAIIFVEKIRHITVHRGGIVADKSAFFATVAKDCGVYNNGNIDNIFTEYMEFFFGGGKYEKLLNITEERVHKNIPIRIEVSRFEMLLDSMLLCVFVLCQESQKYIENLVEKDKKIPFLKRLCAFIRQACIRVKSFFYSTNS